MGLLKKIFKPVSKVLDKIVPNEVKPFLPYAAAFAPFIAPGIMGTSVMQRALMGGGLNIFGQLAQEGNEGDINLLSAGLGALSGAMTAPGGTAADFSAAGSMEGPALTKTPGFRDYMASGIEKYGAESAGGQIFTGLDKASKFMTDPGLMKYGIPAATATGDLMFAQAKRDQDEYDRMMEEEAENEYASDASRALAIRQSMESYGFTEEEILAAIEAAGYKAGGRVGLEFGGMPGALAATALKEEDKTKYITKKDDIEIMNRIFTEGGHEGLNAYIEKNPELTDKYVNIMVNQDDEVIAIPNQLYDMENMLEIQGGDGSGIILLNNEMFENKAKGGRVGAEEGGLMNLGGKEMDMRGGGFIPIGKKERADDVPARLSKNEFVMTADAVRAAGGGSVNEGAKRMYETMNKLEARA